MTNNTKIKILLAEDDSFINRAYKDGLERAGFEVTTAIDGDEAMSRLKLKKPDIMLLDLVMPNKNGFEVLEEMKNDKELKTIPVIVLSNLGQDSDIKKCKELGAVDYLLKSDITIKDVVEKIKNTLEK